MGAEQGYTNLEGGYINSVLKVGDCVVKRYIGHPTITTSKEQRFESEVAALTLFGGTFAPRLFSYDVKNLCVSMEYLDGENLKYIIENGTSEEKKYFCVKQTGQIARLLHSNVLEVTTREKSDYIDDKRRRSLASYQYLCDSGIGSRVGIDMDRLLRRLIRKDIPTITRQVHATSHFSSLHGDFWLPNIIGNQEQGAVLGIIDWEYFHYGMRHEDLAQIMMWDFRSQPQYIPPFFEGYGQNLDIDSFIFTTALEYATSGSLEDYESEGHDGFIKTHVTILKDMLSF